MQHILCHTEQFNVLPESKTIIVCHFFFSEQCLFLDEKVTIKIPIM